MRIAGQRNFGGDPKKTDYLLLVSRNCLNLFLQIFHEGKLLYYINGRDENKSSWMRYIRCARHRGEQNMFAFQYCGNIYYRAFKDIPARTELLVWYDDKYPQYMGIPLEICETSPRKPVGKKGFRGG